MKIFYFLLLTFIIVGMSSCGGDDDNCERNLAGTYVGTEITGFFSSEDATIVISGTDGNYSANGGSLDNLSLDQNDCVVRFESSALGIESRRVEFVITDSTLTFERFLLGSSASTFSGVKQ